MRILTPKKKLKCFSSRDSKTSTNQQSNQTNKAMSATIMMPTQIESAIREMCTDAMSQAVAALAEKYGFDAEEANRFLSDSDVKIVRKRGPSPKKEKDGKKESKAKADKGDKPKRGKTGYLLYADEVRAEVKAELEAELADGEKLKPQDVVKAIAARWKEEESEVRDEWNAKAKTPVTSDDEAEAEKPKAEAENPKAKAEPKAKTEAKNNPKPKADKKKAKEPEPEPEVVSDAESDEE